MTISFTMTTKTTTRIAIFERRPSTHVDNANNSPRSPMVGVVGGRRRIDITTVASEKWKTLAERRQKSAKRYASHLIRK